MLAGYKSDYNFVSVDGTLVNPKLVRSIEPMKSGKNWILCVEVRPKDQSNAAYVYGRIPYNSKTRAKTAARSYEGLIVGKNFFSQDRKDLEAAHVAS